VQLSARALAALALLAAFQWASPGAAGAAGQIAYAPCAASNDFACGQLAVPLDPSGATPGSLTLSLRRHRAPVGEARTAIIALAGGPGQPALPLAEQFLELLGPVADTRDLIVFDQRGVGLSGPLACHAFERPGRYSSLGTLVEACADQLGPTRDLYTSADSVADIEAIRQAGGYEKLVLYGTSYGTKVAELYAEEHPDQVEALVLDSVVPPAGPDPLERATFAAIPRILRQICGRHACDGITRDPVGDLAHLLSIIRRRGLSGREIDGEGRPHTVRVSADDLLALLLAGDLSDLMRSQFVTDVRAALRGDHAPLARLIADASGEEEGGDFDTPLYYATTCEEQDFPWNRAASPQTRLTEGRNALLSLPSSTFAPFAAADAIDLSDIPGCASWPFSAPFPASPNAPLPDVPTLILSGADDLRTPTAGAREVAAEIPDSHLLVVPYTGHSVLGSEHAGCAEAALQAIFAGEPVAACKAGLPPVDLRPPPLPPPGLGRVSPAGGYRGRLGSTLHAVALTLTDLSRQLELQLGEEFDEGVFSFSTLRTGGLRAGWAKITDSRLTLRGYSYVPGVSISGTLIAGDGTVQIGGAAAVPGSLRASASGALVGTLAGLPVRLPAISRAVTAILGVDAQERARHSPRDPARPPLAGRLPGLLAGSIGP